MTDLLVIAPHPDDEVLGCGATMARYLREGKTVNVFFVSDGAFPGRLVDLGMAALEALGQPPRRHPEPPKGGTLLTDQRFELSSRAELADGMAAVIDRLQPRTILIPFYGDVNLDHRVTFEAAMVACRPTRTFIERVACYETASSTEWGAIHPFRPNWYVEVSNADMTKKLDALQVYDEQMKPHPHPRGPEAQTWKAKTRGREVVAYNAEAFQIVREVTR